MVMLTDRTQMTRADDEEKVARPTRRVRNVVDSDDDGDVVAGPVHPPGV